MSEPNQYISDITVQEIKEETLDRVKTRVLELVSQRSRDPLVMDLANTVCDLIDDEYKNKDVPELNDCDVEFSARKTLQFRGNEFEQCLRIYSVSLEGLFWRIIKPLTTSNEIRSVKRFIEIARAL